MIHTLTQLIEFAIEHGESVSAKLQRELVVVKKPAKQQRKADICPHYLQDFNDNNVCSCAGKLPPVA